MYRPTNPTITPTPFQPIPLTPSFIPTAYLTPELLQSPPALSSEIFPALANTWGNFAGPSAYPAIAIPPPIGKINQPANQVNILIMGSDQRLFDGGYRTDVILLLTLNVDKGTASLTSFPRDLFVYIPGWTMERINTAHAHGGFELTAQMMEYNFGVRPDHWVLINFGGFVSIVNVLGGINVQVASTLSDTRDGYGYYTVPAGSFHMNGDTALWYVRSRGTSNDFDRTRRQQEVLQAIFYQVISLDGITRAPELYGQYEYTMSTDMTMNEILPLLPLASQLAISNDIYRYAIGNEHISPWTNPNTGAQVLLPIRASVLSIMEQALSKP
ncbi:MAG: LCP family protein [Chloroflexota bacterium]